jgi:hypothetical protein
MKKKEEDIKSEWIQYFIMDSDGDTNNSEGFDTYAEALLAAKELAQETMKNDEAEDGDFQVGIFKLDKVVRIKRSVNVTFEIK